MSLLGKAQAVVGAIHRAVKLDKAVAASRKTDRLALSRTNRLVAHAQACFAKEGLGLIARLIELRMERVTHRWCVGLSVHGHARVLVSRVAAASNQHRHSHNHPHPHMGTVSAPFRFV